MAGLRLEAIRAVAAFTCRICPSTNPAAPACPLAGAIDAPAQAGAAGLQADGPAQSPSASALALRPTEPRDVPQARRQVRSGRTPRSGAKRPAGPCQVSFFAGSPQISSPIQQVGWVIDPPLCTDYSQSSTRSPSTRPNSRVLCVTSVSPRASACPAISTS